MHAFSPGRAGEDKYPWDKPLKLIKYFATDKPLKLIKDFAILIIYLL